MKTKTKHLLLSLLVAAAISAAIVPPAQASPDNTAQASIKRVCENHRWSYWNTKTGKSWKGGHCSARW